MLTNWRQGIRNPVELEGVFNSDFASNWTTTCRCNRFFGNYPCQGWVVILAGHLRKNDDDDDEDEEEQQASGDQDSGSGRQGHYFLANCLFLLIFGWDIVSLCFNAIDFIISFLFFFLNNDKINFMNHLSRPFYTNQCRRFQVIQTFPFNLVHKLHRTASCIANIYFLRMKSLCLQKEDQLEVGKTPSLD